MNLDKYFTLSFLILLSSCTLHDSTITEIHSIKQAQSTLDRADEQTLVIFDVDDTLTYNVNIPFQPWFSQTEAGKQFFSQVKKHIQSQENPADYEKLIRGKRMLEFTDQPLEPEIVTAIKRLQSRGVKVIALTRMMTGSLRRTLIPSLPEWRWQKLHEVGFDFSSSFEPQEIWLTQLTSKANRHPLFYKGILMTDEFNKGEVLDEFLNVIGFRPNNVIFFDDRPEFVESVQAAMKNRSIPFHGFVYKAIDTLPTTLNQEVLDYQLRYLQEHDEFISDEQARKAISQKKDILSPIHYKEMRQNFKKNITK